MGQHRNLALLVLIARRHIGSTFGGIRRLELSKDSGIDSDQGEHMFFMICIKEPR